MIMRWFAGLVLTALACNAGAVAPETVRELAFGDNDAKAKAISALASSGDASALPLLQALLDGEVQTVGDARVLWIKGEAGTDLVTGEAVTPLPESRDDVVINNRIRKELGTAIAALKLTAPQRAQNFFSSPSDTVKERAEPGLHAASKILGNSRRKIARSIQ